MRNIPVDTSALTFVCVSPPRPKLVSQETGEVKVDRDGNTVYTVGLSAADELGRVDVLSVSVPESTEATIGQIVTPIALVAVPWTNNGRSGVAYRAKDVVPAAAPVAENAA
ncbi:hypothetical protein ACFVH6_21570 [Spirillospora sp. NPDC127200]